MKTLSLIRNNFFKIIKIEVFYLKRFGYGQDHDATIMKNIADLKKGSFYFISDL
jgi:hypothetical protein